MLFHRTGLEGAWLIETQPIADERGSFARTFCVEEFARQGLESGFVQHSLSRSTRRHTLRGMHFQRAPHGEVKLVSCISGAIHDVIVDLRQGSPSYLEWRGFDLTPANGLQLYIPKGFAHGFQTLEDDTAVNYLISEFYAPQAASGVRFDDPALAIKWPAAPTVISRKDQDWPLLTQAFAG